MAKSKRTKKRYPGVRWTVYFVKGKIRNRVRAFPSENGYKVSVTQRVDGKTTQRSVEGCVSLEAAKAHVQAITERALKSGWTQSAGAAQNNLSLF